MEGWKVEEIETCTPSEAGWLNSEGVESRSCWRATVTIPGIPRAISASGRGHWGEADIKARAIEVASEFLAKRRG